MALPARVLSLCSGYGGLDLGLRLAVPAARTVCYVEREAYAAALLAARCQEGALDDAPVWGDLATFDGAAWRGLVDTVIGGYPCQPFSVAGKRGGESDPRHLWPHIARVVAEVRPRWCFFENVRNHINIGLREVRADLRGMGYRVEAGIYSAEEVGAPHRRERLFILAHAERPQRWEDGEGDYGHRADTERQAPDRPTTVRNGSLVHPADAGGRAFGARGDGGGAGGDGDGQADGGPRIPGGILADANGPRRSQPGGSLAQQRGWPLDGGEELGSFPPGPGERDAWAAILARWPHLAPAVGDTYGNGRLGPGLYLSGWGQIQAIPDADRASTYADGSEKAPQSPVRGLADGPAVWVAGRGDQLRAGGNGCVPLQCAYAFINLYRRFEG